MNWLAKKGNVGKKTTHKKGKVYTKRAAAVVFPHAPPVALPAITALPFTWDRELDGRLENLENSRKVCHISAPSSTYTS